MFGIGTSELLVIILVAVAVLGPDHLPKIVRTVTKVMSDVRRVSTEFQRTINLEANKQEWEEKQAAETKKKKKKKAVAKPKKTPPPEEIENEAAGQAKAAEPERGNTEETAKAESSAQDAAHLTATPTFDASIGLGQSVAVTEENDSHTAAAPAPDTPSGEIIGTAAESAQPVNAGSANAVPDEDRPSTGCGAPSAFPGNGGGKA